MTTQQLNTLIRALGTDYTSALENALSMIVQQGYKKAFLEVTKHMNYSVSDGEEIRLGTTTITRDPETIRVFNELREKQPPVRIEV